MPAVQSTAASRESVAERRLDPAVPDICDVRLIPGVGVHFCVVITSISCASTGYDLTKFILSASGCMALVWSPARAEDVYHDAEDQCDAEEQADVTE